MASHKAAEYLKKVTVANLHSSSSTTKDIHFIDVHDNLHHAVEVIFRIAFIILIVQVLASKHIYAIPVYDSGKPVGLLSLRSIVNFLLVLLEEKAGAFPNATDAYAKLSAHAFTTDEIKSVTDHFNRHPVSALMSKLISRKTILIMKLNLSFLVLKPLHYPILFTISPATNVSQSLTPKEKS